MPGSSILARCVLSARPQRAKQSLDQRATRDLDALSVHPAILLGEKRGDHGSDIVRMPDTSQCRQPGDLLVLLQGYPVPFPPLKSVAMAPGATVVYGDAAWTEFFCQVSRKHLDSTLHAGISGASRKGESGQPRRDHYDSSAIVHQRQKLLREEEHTLKVNVVETIEVFFRDLVEWRMMGRASVID